jgi:hypothetical protein
VTRISDIGTLAVTSSQSMRCRNTNYLLVDAVILASFVCFGVLYYIKKIKLGYIALTESHWICLHAFLHSTITYCASVTQFP